MNATLPASIIQKYYSLLTNDVEELFFKYFSGYNNNGFGRHVSTHVGNINKLESFAEKFRYALDIIFPPKAFMIQKYNISDKRLVNSDKRLVNSDKQTAEGSDKRLVISDKLLVVDNEQQTVSSKQSAVPITRDVASSIGRGNSKLRTGNYKLVFWWLWYPYRWWVGVKGVFRVISGK
jgi:hypothetical protein